MNYLYFVCYGHPGLACNTILSINSRIEDSKNEEEALSWLRVASKSRRNMV